MPFNVIFSNKSSELNKKLIKFFQINLLSLNKASLIFDFEVAHPSNIDSYVKRGIKNYPIMVCGDEHVIGVQKIMQHLKKCVVDHNNKIINKTDDERVDDFWKQTIGKIEYDAGGNLKPEEDDNESDAGENLQHRIQEAFEQRNTETVPIGNLKKNMRSAQGNTKVSHGDPSTRSNNLQELSPSKTLATMAANGKSHMDDVLMAQFFENQEES